MSRLAISLILSLPTLALAQQREINWKQIQQPLIGDVKLGDATGTITAPTGEFTHLLNLPRISNLGDQTKSAVVGSTVYSSTEGKVYVYDGTAWREIMGGGGEPSECAVSQIIVAVTDLTVPGATYYRYILPRYSEPDSPYYGKAWRGAPVIRIGVDAELTPYALLLPGSTVGSHRGVRVNLERGDVFSESWRVVIYGVMEDAGGVPWSDLNREGGCVVQMLSDPLSVRMSNRFARR